MRWQYMNEMMTLYASGRTYEEYLEAADQLDKEKHLHYLHKMKLTVGEKKQVMAIKKPVTLLIFCNISCNDCRIALAILENMSVSNQNLQFRIVDREVNKAIMETIDQNCKIPMIVKLMDDAYNLIFNEVPESFRERTVRFETEQMESERLSYRKGLYKDEIFEQLMDSLIY